VARAAHLRATPAGRAVRPAGRDARPRDGHARFFREYNEQKHFAHQERPAGRQSPTGVLGFVHGAWCDPADLDRLFRVQAHRRVDGAGFVRYRRWRLYGERGLAGAEAAVWVLGETLSIEYAKRRCFHRMTSDGTRADGTPGDV